MKLTILLLLFINLSFLSFAQINMGNLGTVTTGCGQNFYDSGGAGGDYGSSQNYTASFCAPAGQYITFTFSQFALGSGDNLAIYNGPNTGSPLIGNYPATSPGQVSSTLGGCLTFVFTSNAPFLFITSNGAGWTASISCATTIPPPPPPPPGSCAGAQPFCTSTGVNYPAAVGTTSESGPNYGCLSTQPSPGWFYLNIATAGNIQINLSNSAAHDIDFAIWGPFATQAAMCAGTTATPLDCSYSTSATEQVDIPNAVVGQWYIMVITNYANTPTNITATAGNAAGVDGTTNCNILCNMTGLTATPGACVSPANTYTVTGQISVAYPPTSGTLTVTSSCGGTVNVPTPWTSPIAYTLPGLTANGAACSITATFSADPTCSLTTPYTAPAACTSTCAITSVSASPSACLVGNTYNVTGSVAFTSPPASGTMTVSSSCGGTQTFNAPFTSPIAYSLNALTANGAACVVTASFSATACSLTQNFTSPAIPVPNAGIDQIICVGSSATLTASGASTYTWNNGITNGVAFTPAATTTYTVTGTNASGCTATDAAIVTVNPLATANAGPIQSVCAGGTITLAGAIGGGATSGTWSAPSGTFSNTSSLTSTYTPSITTGTVILTLTTNDPAGPCNAATSTVVITVNPLPVPASTNATICVGASGTITASGGGTYSWNTGPVTAALTVSPVATTIYTVTVTSALGCVSTTTGTITVNPLPAVGAGVDQTICAGASVTLSGSGASTYTWNNGVTNGVAFSPAATTTYTVTGTSAAGCINTDQVVVTVNPLPIVVANDLGVCAGGTIALTASGASTYTWSPGTYLSATSGASVNFTAGLTTTYTVTGTSAAGCISTDPITVSVLANAPINAGVDVAICVGASTTLIATGGTTYTWNNGLGVGNNFVVSPAATTTYTVVGTDAGGCTGTDAITVTVNTLPTVNAGLDQTVCAGVAVTLSGSGASTYTWNNGVTNGVAFTPAATTTYTVTGTSVAGCINTDQVIVTVNPIPVVGAGADQTVCAGTVVTLTGSGASTYTWTGGVTNGVAFTPAATANYTVTGTSAAGCTSTDIVTVTVNPLPTTNAGVDQTVCSGTSVTLTAIGATTYSWNNGVTNGIAFTPAVGSITYTVTGTTGAGCTTTDQVIVTVNPNPVPAINGPSAYCTGNFALLSTSAPFTTYLWSTGAATPTINATIANNPISVTVTNGFGCVGTSPVFPIIENTVITANFTNTICQGQSSLIHGVSQTVAGVYSQTFVLGTGCDSVANVTLVVNPLPVVNAGVDQAVCTGIATTLSASGATTYTWNNGITNGISFTQAIGSVTYTATGTSALGCVNTDQVIVTVNPLPVINAGPDQAICIGASATISGSGGSTYTWNNGVTNGVAFTPAITNTYTVTGTDLNGCINTDQVIVTVNPLPPVNAGVDQVTCIGGIVTLSGAGAGTYTWNNGVTNALAFSPLATATYTVTGTDGNGCVNTDQVVVTVNPLPTVNAGIDQTVCFGTSVTLSGSGANTYSWDNGVTNGVSFVPAVGTLTYTVTGTSGANCIATDQVDVTVNPIPVVGAGVDQAVCAGVAVTLNGSGAATYTWDNGVTNGLAFVPVSTTTYTVTGTSAFGCEFTDQVVVTVNPIPNVFAGNDLVLCENETATLTGSGASTYTWDNGITNGTMFTPAVGTTTYTVTGTTAFGCTNTDQMTILVNPLPAVSFMPGATLGCVPLTTTLTNTSPNSTNCVWAISNGDVLTGCGPITTTFDQAGCFDITLTTTDINGCSNSFTSIDVICTEAYPIASFSPSESVLTTMNTEVLFTNNSIGASDYSWDLGDNSPFTNVVNPIHTYIDQEGTYVVTLIATSSLGCVDTAYATIQINEALLYYVPNTFTPDADDYNPTFQPVFTSGFDPYDYTLLIFNRWGEVIFESHDATVGWNGSYGSNGEVVLCEDGTYTWKIEFKTKLNDERKMIFGHVNLIR